MASDHLTKLSLASLDNLADGEAGRIIDAAIQRAVNDLRQYPGQRRSRKVIVELSLTFSPSEARWVAVVKAQTHLPSQSSKETVGVFEVTGGSPEALFCPSSAKNPDQLLLFDGIDSVDSEELSHGVD